MFASRSSIAAKRLIPYSVAGAGLVSLGRAALRRRRRFEFQERTVLVTGGSRGLGLLLAREFVARGARVAICAREAEEVERARQHLSRHGAEVMGLVCDVADGAQVDEMVSRIAERWGPVEVLINNAGEIRVGPLEVMTPEDYERALAVHFRGPLQIALAVLPEMRRRRAGRIVNIASLGGLLAVPHLSPYCASKFALVGLSQGLRAELLKEGIYVTTVCPGLMRTGSHDRARFKGRRDREHAWFSVSASAPVVSMDAERAAARILRACRDGQAVALLSWTSRAAALAQGSFPGATSEAMSLVARCLPAAGGMGTSERSGRQSRAPWLPGWATRPGDRAARRNLEI